MNKYAKVKFILLLSCCFLLLVSCGLRDVTYDGDEPELFSLALHSLLGVRGFQGGTIRLPYITVVEEDEYGRILFSYIEDRVDSLLIIQKVDNDYAYFYPHYNFIIASTEERWGFLDGNVENLKEINSWNQPMSDNSEFERVPIILLKEIGPVSLDILNEVRLELFPQATNRITSSNVSYRMNFLRTDRYGRSVYLAIAPGSERQRNPIAVFFQPDHSFDLGIGALEITDMNNYQTELRLFMEENGWNEPWDE